LPFAAGLFAAAAAFAGIRLLFQRKRLRERA
jgi:hypothetical protein